MHSRQRSRRFEMKNFTLSSLISSKGTEDCGKLYWNAMRSSF
uniref:Uncharacterized protein n=1 Tax=Arundo donax TaxID=35708 RepID=A0A0A9HBZ5_ARUDO